MIRKLTFHYMPKGPFDLSFQNSFFDGWPTLISDPNAIVMTFPVEGWKGAAAVVLKQAADGHLAGQIYSDPGVAAKAKEQALACLSLDIAAEEWPKVGERDAVIGELQNKYRYLRPALFHSPYEAAAAFVIGHRSSIKQRRVIMHRMSEELGEKTGIEDQTFHAFPGPQKLMALATYKGLSELKIERLHGVARAALEGLLDRKGLLALPTTDSLAKVQTIPGIGPFFAQGILHRGAGLVDDITTDDLTRYAVQIAYKLNKPPDLTTLLEIAEPWRPFRMWALILLHIWVRREIGVPKKRTFAASR